LRSDQARGCQPKDGQQPDQGGKRTEGRTRFHGSKEISRALFSARKLDILPLRLMTVEEADPMALAEEGRQTYEEDQQLNLTWSHVRHLLSLEPEVL
jgi:hypothetical protein